MKIRILLSAAVLFLGGGMLNLAVAQQTAASSDSARMDSARAAMAQEKAELQKNRANLEKKRVAIDEKRSDVAKSRAELQQLRQQMDHMARRLADLSRRLGEPAPQAFAYRYLSDPDAGMLGLVMFPDANGLTVEAVSPGSPAEEAGIAHGDRILTVNGKSIGSKGVVRLEQFRDIKAGQKIRLKIEHKGKPRNVTLKAERREMPAWATLLDGKPGWNDRNGKHVDIERLVRESRNGAAHERVLMRSFAPWWGLNLVSLNKDLGSYFGTEKGALLLASDEDSLPGLKAGDVITRIDKQVISRPEDAMRALNEHGDQTVTASIMRHGKSLQVTLKLPQHPMLVPPPPPEPPAPPPAPPKPPAAPRAAAPPTPPSPPDHAQAPPPNAPATPVAVL